MINWKLVDSVLINGSEPDRLKLNDEVVWEKSGGDIPDEQWSAVINSISDGTYYQYSIGDIVGEIDLENEGIIEMQVAGIDADIMSDGRYYAALSLIGNRLLQNKRRMNPQESGTIGTGAIGGWEHTELRDALNENVLPVLPSYIQDNIVNVSKPYRSYAADGTRTEETVVDGVWIPDYTELYSASGKYADLFKTNNNRIKKNQSGVNTSWWTRHPGTKSMFYCVSYAGNAVQTAAETEAGVPLCFCIGRGAANLSASQVLRMMLTTAPYNPALDDGDDISDEKALEIIIGGDCND